MFLKLNDAVKIGWTVKICFNFAKSRSIVREKSSTIFTLIKLIINHEQRKLGREIGEINYYVHIISSFLVFRLYHSLRRHCEI